MGEIRKLGRGEAQKAADGEHTVYAHVGVWAQKNQSGTIYIHIANSEQQIHSSVTCNPGSRKRYQPTLFRDLRRLLIRLDAWQFGDEGEEATGQAEPEPDTAE